MKQILISIKPKWVTRILVNLKTLEIRKTAPKEWVDYLNGKTDKKPKPMTVFIYCTKGDYIGYLPKKYVGKIVAKFALKEVIPIVAQRMGNDGFIGYGYCKKRDFKWYHQIEKQVCLSEDGLTKYLNNGNIYVSFKNNQKPKNGYAWRISNLKIFDDPKDLEQFDYPNPSGIVNVSQRSIKGLPNKKHPPQSWCYVEENE